MPDRISPDQLTLSYILSDAAPESVEQVKAASQAFIEAVLPPRQGRVDDGVPIPKLTDPEFIDPEFVEKNIFPLLYERFLSWQSFSDLKWDEPVSIARFCESIRNYARRMKRQRTFTRVRPSEYFVEKTYEQHISLYGARYSSVPPAANGIGEGVDVAPPPSVEGDYITRYMSEQVIGVAQELMVSLVGLAGSGLGCSASQDYIDRLLEAFEKLKQDRSRTLAPFIQMLFQNETRVHLRAFMYRFEDWFFGTFIEMLGKWQGEGSRLLEEGRVKDLKEIARGINDEYEKGAGYLSHMRDVTNGLRKILNETEVGRPYREEWKGYVMRARTLGHDYGNFLMSLLHASVDIRKLSEGGSSESTEIVESLMQPFDASSVVSIIDMIVRMAGKDADGAGVSLKRSRLDDVTVPYDYRAPFFRIVHELVRNAIKYHDDKKKDRFVRVESRLEKGELIVGVTDNGVGIKDIEEVFKWSYRERPELAMGTGVGLTNVEKLAKAYGWRMEMKSQVGEGTEARLHMRVMDWNLRGPEDPEGMGEPGCDPGGTSLSGATGAAGLTSTAYSSAVFASARTFLTTGLP